MPNTRKNPHDPDSPFLTEDFFKKARTFQERFPGVGASATTVAEAPEIAAIEETEVPPGQQTTNVALSAEVVRQLRATGPEWPQLADRILREALNQDETEGRITFNRTDGDPQMPYPEKYRYAKSHEWLLIEGETGTVGITDYAQSSLGDIVFVELPNVGQRIEAGSTFGSVESVKAVSDLYAPVTGTVTEINEALNTAPETINADANETWMIKVELLNTDDANSLLSAADYETFVSEETGH